MPTINQLVAKDARGSIQNGQPGFAANPRNAAFARVLYIYAEKANSDCVGGRVRLTNQIEVTT